MNSWRGPYRRGRASCVHGLVLATLPVALSACGTGASAPTREAPAPRTTVSSSARAVPATLLSALRTEIGQLHADCGSSWSDDMIGSDACAGDITNLILAIDQSETYVLSNSHVGQALSALADDLTTYSVRLGRGRGGSHLPARIVSDAEKVQAGENSVGASSGHRDSLPGV